MSIPKTYSEWVNLLEKYGCGDDTTLEELNNVHYTVDVSTAPRFYVKVEEAYKKRKLIWFTNFQRSFQMQNFKKEEDFEIALRNGKESLSSLNNFISLNGLPDDLRKVLKKDLEDYVSEIKKSLKEKVSKISNGREKLLIMANNFGLTKISELPKKESNNIENIIETIPPHGRKILFQSGK